MIEPHLITGRPYPSSTCCLIHHPTCTLLYSLLQMWLRVITATLCTTGAGGFYLSFASPSQLQTGLKPSPTALCGCHDHVRWGQRVEQHPGRCRIAGTCGHPSRAAIEFFGTKSALRLGTTSKATRCDTTCTTCSATAHDLARVTRRVAMCAVQIQLLFKSTDTRAMGAVVIVVDQGIFKSSVFWTQKVSSGYTRSHMPTYMVATHRRGRRCYRCRLHSLDTSAAFKSVQLQPWP